LGNKRVRDFSRKQRQGGRKKKKNFYLGEDAPIARLRWRPLREGKGFYVGKRGRLTCPVGVAKTRLGRGKGSGGKGKGEESPPPRRVKKKSRNIEPCTKEEKKGGGGKKKKLALLDTWRGRECWRPWRVVWRGKRGGTYF